MTNLVRINVLSISVILMFLFSGASVSGQYSQVMKKPDPLKELVALKAAPDWNARLLWASDAGVWSVELIDVIKQCAGFEIAALDDRGRCVLLNLNASKVSFWQPVMDGMWLGAVFQADIDPLWPGPELYVGGSRGNLYQIIAHPQGGFSSRIIAYFPGKEIHMIIAADLDSALAGKELYAGLVTGELFRIFPIAKEDRSSGKGDFMAKNPSLISASSCPGWKTVLVHKDPGRIRDGIILKNPETGSESMVYVSRSGRMAQLSSSPKSLNEKLIFNCKQGLARIDLGKSMDGEDLLYVAGDDGQVMRFQKDSGGVWRRELIYTGTAGARGIATGSFDKDQSCETVALFGYSGNVEILRRDDAGTWTSETIFTDLDKGHWLVTGDLDDRNSTDEIVISGYSGRVVLISRPPGYGK